jgi:hypothetical protein
MTKLTISVLAVTLLCVLGVRVFSTSQETKDVKAQAQERKQRDRERGQRFYQGYGSKQNLRELARASADDVYVERGLGLYLLADPSPLSLRTHLAIMSCSADAVVIGEVKSKTAKLTEDETGIVTEYGMAVEEVLKDNAGAPIASGSQLTVARTGGSLQLGDRKIVAQDRAFKPLEVGGRYLLFLQSVPGRNSYAAANSQGSFMLRGNEVQKLTEEQLPEPLEREKQASSLIADIRAAAAEACAVPEGGGAK